MSIIWVTQVVMGDIIVDRVMAGQGWSKDIKSSQAQSRGFNELWVEGDQSSL